MKRIGITAFLLMFFLTSSCVFATTFYYIATIMVGDSVADVAFDGSSVLAMHNGYPDKIAFYDMGGNFLKSFDTLVATTAGMTYNGSRGTILFSGDIDGYSGRLYEMNPENGAITGPVIEDTWIQPYLAHTGSLILSSWGATGLDGILNIPIDRYNSTTYDYVDTISITIDTGTEVTGISRIPIAFGNGYLYVKLAIEGFNDKLYEYNPDLSFSGIINLSNFGPNVVVGAMTFIGNDLLVANGSTDVIYRYSTVPPEFLLSVSKQGTGSGNVLSSPPGIDCGASCNASFMLSTTVTLTATPDVNSIFAYWSGGCIGAAEVCTITMTEHVTVTAHFVSDETKEYKLSVGKKRINKGDGLITSDDGIISCGETCTGLYYPNAPVTLRATPSPGSLFEGWSPTSLNCGTSPTCSFIMDTKHKVKPIFRGPYRLLTKIKSKNSGSGSVTADISGIGTGINCPASSCEDYYPYGNNVVLTAQPGGGSQFMGWKPVSLGCGTSLTCTAPMTKKWSVTATFEGM